LKAGQGFFRQADTNHQGHYHNQIGEYNMKKFRVGVIGCTGVGTRHALGVSGLPNAELAAGCDLSQEVLDKFKETYREEWPDLALYTSYQDMLENADLDIVTVATSDHRHADMVIDAARAGARGIFCEKPLATTLAEADHMIEACAASNTILSIDHTRRFNPLWRHTKEEIVDKGVIGSVHYIIGTLSGPRAMLFRNGTHLIDAICYFADSAPEWVMAELEPGYEDYAEYRGDGGHDPQTEPAASGYIHFKNGVRGFYPCGFKSSTVKDFRLEIMGSEGIIFIDKNGATIHKDSGVEPIQAPDWPVVDIPAGIQELVRLVAEGGQPVSPGTEALKVVEIIMGFLESQRQGNAKIPITSLRS
jgi:predicted dehydrogenase